MRRFHTVLSMGVLSISDLMGRAANAVGRKKVKT
jgi:hypothetical protein